jgi:hypothetical protein
METMNTNNVDNYTHSIEVKTTADKAYKALTSQIPLVD